MLPAPDPVSESERLTSEALRDLVEYVVCHELLHLKVPGHGKGWQALMGIYLPDWRERELRLAGWMIAGGR
jgi:predicted metal-dependent hydrolase